MKKGFFLLVFIFIGVTGHSQTGYLGSLNSVEFKVNMAPSWARKNTTKDLDGVEYVNSGLRYALPSYQLNISRTLTRRIELSLGFDFSSMTLLVGNVATPISTSYVLQESLKANRIGGNFEFRYYRKGCFSPIGKFVGFSLNFGKANVKTDDGLVYGTTGSAVSDGGYFAGSNFFSRKRFIESTATETVLTRESGSYTALRLIIGRNYPLGYGLTLNVGVSAPLISFYKNAYNTDFGFRMLGESEPRITNGNLENSLKYTLHKYNRVQLNVSIKKYF